MNAAIISALGAFIGAAAMVLVYLLSKKHNENIETQAAENSHVTAISSASETLAEAVNVLIAPLNKSILRLQEQEREMAIEMTKVKAELALMKSEHRKMNRDFLALIRYVQTLWLQIKGFGSDPAPPPDDLAHITWHEFDDDNNG